MTTPRWPAVAFVSALLAVAGCDRDEIAPTAPTPETPVPIDASLHAVSSSSGQIEEIAPPASVQHGDLTSDEVMFIFEERDAVLAEDLDVDVTAPGTYDLSNVLSSEGTIPAGTEVSSHFIHAQPTDLGSGTYEATVSFDSEILGIILQTARLDATDETLGAPGTLYAGSSFDRRFIHGEGGLDRLVVHPDLQTIDVRIWVGNPAVDDIRILTLDNANGADISKDTGMGVWVEDKGVTEVGRTCWISDWDVQSVDLPTGTSIRKYKGQETVRLGPTGLFSCLGQDAVLEQTIKVSENWQDTGQVHDWSESLTLTNADWICEVTLNWSAELGAIHRTVHSVCQSQ